MLEGKSMPSNMAVNTNQIALLIAFQIALLKNQSAIKYLR